jgi:hypothetical protein
MGRQNSLSIMILNSKIVYLDGKIMKDITTLKPEISYEDVDFEDIEENYEIVFYDKDSGIMRLEKYNKNQKILYTLGGLPPKNQ